MLFVDLENVVFLTCVVGSNVNNCLGWHVRDKMIVFAEVARSNCKHCTDGILNQNDSILRGHKNVAEYSYSLNVGIKLNFIEPLKLSNEPNIFQCAK